MTKRKMRGTVPVYASVVYYITVRFDAYSGDTPETMRFNAAQMFRFIGHDVSDYETITIEEEK